MCGDKEFINTNSDKKLPLFPLYVALEENIQRLSYQHRRQLFKFI